MATAGTIKFAIGADIRGLVQGVNRSKNLLGGLGNSVHKISRSLMSIKGVFAAFGTFMLAKSFLDTASSMERLQVSLDKMTHGKGVATFAALNKWARDMPVDTQAAIDAFRLLRAYHLKPTIDDMTVLVDTVSALGGGKDILEGIARALGQISAKGRAMQQEMNQLSERGIPALAILEQKLGLSPAQVAEVGRAGVSSGRALTALMEGMKEFAGGLSQKYMKTWFGLMEQIKSWTTEFKRVVMDSGPFEILKKSAQGFLTYLADSKNKLQIGAWLKITAEIGIRSIDLMTDAATGFLYTLALVGEAVLYIKKLFTGLFDNPDINLAVRGAEQIKKARSEFLKKKGFDKDIGSGPGMFVVDYIQSAFNNIGKTSATLRADLEKEQKLFDAWNMSWQNSLRQFGVQSKDSLDKAGKEAFGKFQLKEYRELAGFKKEGQRLTDPFFFKLIDDFKMPLSKDALNQLKATSEFADEEKKIFDKTINNTDSFIKTLETLKEGLNKGRGVIKNEIDKALVELKKMKSEDFKTFQEEGEAAFGEFGIGGAKFVNRAREALRIQSKFTDAYGKLSTQRVETQRKKLTEELNILRDASGSFKEIKEDLVKYYATPVGGGGAMGLGLVSGPGTSVEKEFKKKFGVNFQEEMQEWNNLTKTVKTNEEAVLLAARVHEVFGDSISLTGIISFAKALEKANNVIKETVNASKGIEKDLLRKQFPEVEKFAYKKERGYLGLSDQEIQKQELLTARELLKEHFALTDEEWSLFYNKRMVESNMLTGMFVDMTGKFTDSLNDMLWSAESSFKDIGIAFAKMITGMIIKFAVFQGIATILNIIAPGAGAGFLGAAGMTGSLGTSATSSGAAKGGLYSGPGISAFSNSIVSSPTIFPFAKGIGLMGEAGSEAIMPLTRMPGGNLGIEARGSGRSDVTFKMENPVFQDQETQRKVFEQIARYITMKEAPNALYEDYNRDGITRTMIRKG